MSSPENSGTSEGNAGEWCDSLPKTPEGYIDWDELIGMDLDGYRGEDLHDEEAAGSKAVGGSEQQAAAQQQAEAPQEPESGPDLPPSFDASQ